MSAEQILYAMGDIRDSFIREALPAGAPRRRRWHWAAGLAACLCLALLIARVRPALPVGGGASASGDTLPADAAGSGAPEPGDPSGPGTAPEPDGADLPAGCPLFPGEISQPLLYWQGTAYAWDRVGAPDQPIGEPPETIDEWTELGPLAGSTAEETAEDLWLYADIGRVSGAVYADPEGHPGVLYVLMTTEWFEEEWVRFVADERLLTPAFFYGGQLYYLDPSQYPPRNAVMRLPAGYEPVGTLVYASDPDRLPSREFESSLNYSYAGSTLYAKPGYDGTLYVECLKVWSGGSCTLYAPATLRPQPWP